MDTEKLGEVYMILNPEDNGGEQVAIVVEIFDNGDYDANSTYTLGKVSLQSYGNSASMSLPNITPELLRKFAVELETEIAKAKKSFGIV